MRVERKLLIISQIYIKWVLIGLIFSPLPPSSVSVQQNQPKSYLTHTVYLLSVLQAIG